MGNVLFVRGEVTNLKLVSGCVFLIVLILTAWQDWRKRSVSLRGLLAAGSFGVVVSAALERSCFQIALSCGVGVLLLVLNRCTNGGIGEGDGWFFII